MKTHIIILLIVFIFIYILFYFINNNINNKNINYTIYTNKECNKYNNNNKIIWMYWETLPGKSKPG